MNDSIVGIKEKELKALILEIYEYRDKMSKILDDAAILASSTSEFYQSDDGIKFREKFAKYSKNFSTFLSNIQSYGQDLENVLLSYQLKDAKNVDIFNKQW